jgi:hypothetical protein
MIFCLNKLNNFISVKLDISDTFCKWFAKAGPLKRSESQVLKQMKAGRCPKVSTLGANVEDWDG